MENKDLIPFSKELWETGEYEAATRNGLPVKVYEITSDKILGSVVGYSEWWRLNGSYYTSNLECDYNLMLRKKTKKVWIPLQEKFVFETKEACERYFSNALEPTKAIEVEIP